jgi:glutamine phosphoribosylpyrophosphate amidotransferase
MCGITGVVDLHGDPIAPAELLAMTSAIAHRGPDDEGFVLIEPETGLTGSYAGAASPLAVRERLGVLASGAAPPRRERRAGAPPVRDHRPFARRPSALLRAGRVLLRGLQRRDLQLP